MDLAAGEYHLHSRESLHKINTLNRHSQKLLMKWEILSFALNCNHERTRSEMTLLMDGSLDEGSDEKGEIFDGSGLL